jgi:hypothetical protein
MSLLCSLDPRQLEPWAECSYNYGVESDDPNDDDRWTRNNIASDAVAFACGRLASPREVGYAPEHLHDAAEARACAELAAAAEERLRGAYTYRGDEGDHPWRAFVSPALLGAPAPAGAAGLVTAAEIAAAFGGALSPRQRFAVSPMAVEVDRAEAEQRDGDANEGARIAEPFREVLRLFAEHADAAVRSSASYARPLEDRKCGCVYTHFFVARTSAGSIVGVCGNTVWT